MTVAIVDKKREYIRLAPKSLIDLYESGTVHNGKLLLYKLITDYDMNNAWNELSKRVSSDKDWEEIFNLIRYAKLKSNQISRVKSDTEIKSDYVRLSKKLESLSSEIKDTIFDIRAYDFFSDEVLFMNGLGHINKLDSLDRYSAASKILKYWPTSSELLQDMSKKIRDEVDKVSFELRSSRKQNESFKEREFIFTLARSFEKKFNANLYGTIAYIATAVFQKVFDKDTVKKILIKK